MEVQYKVKQQQGGKRAVGYVRVSTGKQASSELGLLAQRAIIEAEVQRRKWQLVGILEDAGVSGKNLDRTGFNAVLALLKAKGADALLVAKQDRLGRDVHDLSGLPKLAKRQGWQLVALNLPERDTPEGKFAWHIDAAAAQYWRDVTSERTKAAMDKLPPARRALVGRPVPADVAAHIVRLRRRGHSYYRIAQLLTKQGVATAHGAPRWRHDTVQAIIERVRRSGRP